MGCLPTPVTDPATITKAFHQLIGKKRTHESASLLLLEDGLELELSEYDAIDEIESESLFPCGSSASLPQMVDHCAEQGSNHRGGLILNGADSQEVCFISQSSSQDDTSFLLGSSGTGQ